MNKKILCGLLALVLSISLVGCGNKEASNTKTNDVVKVTESAKQVAEKFNLNYDGLGVDYYFVDGYTDPSGGTVRVHLKEAIENTARQADLISLAESFKNVSDDGKVYSNQEMSKEFNNVVILDTTYFISVYFNLNGKAYKATITQKDRIKNNNEYYYGYDIYIADLAY